jgi:Na+/melibiose symporter-like transporter
VRTEASSGGFADQLRVIRSDRAFRLLLSTFVVQALATGSMLAGVDYVARWILRSPNAASLLFACFVAPALIVTPLWQRFGTARGKKRGYLLASVLLGGGALALVLARSLPTPLVYLSVAVVGIGYAGAQMFPMAMLPDVASRSADSAARVGVYTGVWTAGETLGLALGPAVYAAVLALGGYASSTSGQGVFQGEGAMTAVVIGFSLVPAVLVALSLLALRGYDLPDPHTTPRSR